jgi:L-alanine-DL-glutamate epimerase-like enolase superfamily enzyme
MPISGVDLALWDLRGKIAVQPVASILKPKVELDVPIPTYATVFGDEEIERALATGHRAVKRRVEWKACRTTTALDFCNGLFHNCTCAGPGSARSADKSAAGSAAGWAS